MSEVWHGEQLSERFLELTRLLEAGEIFWRTHAFQKPHLPWENEFPSLSCRLRELSFEQAERLASDNKILIDFISGQLPAPFSSIENICSIGSFSNPPLPDIEPRDIPGRKWQQLRHFVPCVPLNPLAVLEWCAGKSHLGRTLARQRQCAITALEYDANLVVAAKQLAEREHLSIDMQCVDVLSDTAENFMHENQNAVALHACGDLHARFLQCCAKKKIATITLTPCCYHLTQNADRCVLSSAARGVELHLTRDDLRTAVQGTTTAPLRETRQRRQLQAWRLGFDVLQRDVRSKNNYLPTPSLPLSAVKDGFEALCRKLARLKAIDLPAGIDYMRYQTLGERRLHEVTALDLPRIAFRRALELWLVLDRALFLREQGYDVEVGAFCRQALTPRNLLIKATRI